MVGRTSTRPLKHTYAAGQTLPPDERDSLKRLYMAIDVALRNR